jgi:hypothetical protein
MLCAIEVVTARLDALVDEYLIRDATGKIITEIGYPRKTEFWPHTEQGYAEWAFHFEQPPHFQSTGEIRLVYVIGERKQYTRLSPGFYINDFIDGEPKWREFGQDLEAAILGFKAKLNIMPRREA